MTVKIKSIVLFILIAGCNDKVDTKADGEKLMELSREWSKLAAQNDIEKMLGYWAEDATVMFPGQLPIKGKKAIREMIEGTSKIPGFKISWEPLSSHVSKSGDMAYLIEQNQISMLDSTGKQITEFNKAVTVWRKEADGSWKNVVDIWNVNPGK